MCHSLLLGPPLQPHSLILSPLHCCLSVSSLRSLLPGHVLSSHSPDPLSSSCPTDALKLFLLSPPLNTCSHFSSVLQLPDPLRLLVTCNSFSHQPLTSYIGPDPLFLCQILVDVMFRLSRLVFSESCYLNLYLINTPFPACENFSWFHPFNSVNLMQLLFGCLDLSVMSVSF